jgi:glycosyltransferase involved in cell wall biosynthesis
MRISVWSNAPHCPTGYGQQTAQLTKRLMADGHEVAVIANWGLSGAPMETDGLTIYPSGMHPYGLDVADFYADHWHQGQRGLVIVLYDTWPLLEAPKLFEKHDAWYWAPVDHAPVPPQVAAWCKDRNVIAMADFGRDQFTSAGMPPAYTIPHAIERDVFKPTESRVREFLEVPADAHLTATVMANIGQVTVRKSWFENLMGWRIFAESHPDAYLYIHTQLRNPRGVDLHSFLQMWGLPLDRVRIVDQGTYTAGMIGPEDLAAIYSTADVTLMATAGEGFGIPAVESAACGTPVIGTDFSAQRQTVCGWKVPFSTIFDYGLGASAALPDINGITAALAESYEIRDARRDECLHFARQFDADTVYAEQWRPFLADREYKPNRQERRANKR